MSEDKLDDIQGRGRVGVGLLQGSSLFQPTRGQGRGQGGAKLKICLSECCLATALLQPIRAGRGLVLWWWLGLHEVAGLKDIITLSRVQLRVISVRHDAAVLTVHLGR